jgi:hypothetical protein
MLTSTSFREESVEGIVTAADGFVTWHLAIWLDTVLQAEKLPARIANLHARLANMDADGLTHG